MKHLLSILIALLPLCATAQTEEVAAVLNDSVANSQLKIAVYSFDQCWTAMPEVAQIKAEVEVLRSQYTEEMKRAEADFQSKYEDFLEIQAKLAPSIRNKRQAELQKILEENLAFKAKAHETLVNTEKEKLQPVKEKLQQTIETVAKEGGYSIVINKDGNNSPFFDASLITDITESIKLCLIEN